MFQNSISINVSQMTLQPYQQLIINEAAELEEAELNDKITLLEASFHGEIFSKLPFYDQQLMMHQIIAMIKYRQILDERITRSNLPPDTPPPVDGTGIMNPLCPRCAEEYTLYFDDAFRIREACGCPNTQELNSHPPRRSR